MKIESPVFVFSALLSGPNPAFFFGDDYGDIKKLAPSLRPFDFFFFRLLRLDNCPPFAIEFVPGLGSLCRRIHKPSGGLQLLLACKAVGAVPPGLQRPMQHPALGGHQTCGPFRHR